MKDMAELSEQAVRAAKFWALKLDYSPESVEDVDVLAQKILLQHLRKPLPEDILRGLAELYGAYLGEVLLRRGLGDLGFAWAENGEGETGIRLGDTWMAPATLVYRRFTRETEPSLINGFEYMFRLAIGALTTNVLPTYTLSGEEAI